MQKTKKSIAKKFKITATGKVLFRKPGFRHFLRRKSTVRLRQAGCDQKLDSAALSKHVKACLPFA